jgi:hypothetical protein
MLQTRSVQLNQSGTPLSLFVSDGLRAFRVEPGDFPQPAQNPFLAHRSENVKNAGSGSLAGDSRPRAIDQNSGLYIQIGGESSDDLLQWFRAKIVQWFQPLSQQG